MTAIARTFYHARRQATEWWGLIVVVSLRAVLMAMGHVLGQADCGPAICSCSPALAIYAATLGRAVLRELGPVAGGEAPRRRTGVKLAAVEAAHEIELGLLLVTGVYILIVATGGCGQLPVPADLRADLVLADRQQASLCRRALDRRRRACSSWSSGLPSARSGLQGPLGHGCDAPDVPAVLRGRQPLGPQQASRRRLRGQHVESVKAELARVRQEARDFRSDRLAAADRQPSSPQPRGRRAAHGPRSRARRARAAVLHDRSACASRSICTRRRSCGSRPTRMSARPASASTPARPRGSLIKELATSSEMICEQPRARGARRARLDAARPQAAAAQGARRPSDPALLQGPRARSPILCVVPLADGKVVRGFLCADRLDNRPFADQEQEALEKAAGQCMRIIEQERAFAAVERGKYEQEQFYRASELLNQALTLDDVYAKSFAALSAMAPYELAVITRHDAGAGIHEVIAVRCHEQLDQGRDQDPPSEREAGPLARARGSHLDGKRFRDGACLVSMAVKNRHHMPANGDYPRRLGPGLRSRRPSSTRPAASWCSRSCAASRCSARSTLGQLARQGLPRGRPRDAAGDQPPDRRQPAKRPHVPVDGGARDDRRAHGPDQPSRLPRAARAAARARRAHRPEVLDHLDRHRSLQERQRYVWASRWRRGAQAGRGDLPRSALARSTSSRATAARNS